MIEINDLHKSYHMGSNTLHVLKGINFNVKEGELVSIMGSSGSGKSTLLNILGMLDEADSGNYTLDGFPIKNLNEKIAANYRNKFLGFIFQSFNLINYKSAKAPISLADGNLLSTKTALGCVIIVLVFSTPLPTKYTLPCSR